MISNYGRTPLILDELGGRTARRVSLDQARATIAAAGGEKIATEDFVRIVENQQSSSKWMYVAGLGALISAAYLMYVRTAR